MTMIRRERGESPVLCQNSAVLALFTVGDVYASLCKKGAYAPVVSKNTNELKIGSPGRFGIDVYTLGWVMAKRSAYAPFSARGRS